MAAPKKYSDELRERATRLALESGRPIAHVAQDLGVHKEALRTWVRQAKADAAGGAPAGLSSAERDELKRLRGEVRELRQANEILRAASVYFAKELDGSRGGERLHHRAAGAWLRRRAHVSHARGLALGAL